MKYLKASLAMFALGAMAVAPPAVAQAQKSKNSTERTSSNAQARGTPQRDSDRTPPGLAKQLASPNHGIMRALIATEGSNSRLQDHPDSP